MRLKEIIRKISEHEAIVKAPPVLFDIGASKEINAFWKKIANFSVCFAFDADERDFKYIEEENANYKRLVKINKLVVAAKTGNEEIYLTKSPYCSSVLEPNSQSLKKFHYASLFEVVKKVKMESIELAEVLKDLSISYIDWLKTDSQGTDLRLIQSIGEDIRKKIIVFELEPGFIDAYKGEDKIVDCLNYFESKKDFFLTRFNVKGPLRIDEGQFNLILKDKLSRKIAKNFYQNVPGWAEITYMNDLDNASQQYSTRDYLLGWLFSTLQGHHEVAYTYAFTGTNKMPDEKIFNSLVKYSARKVKYGVLNFKVLAQVFKLVLKKIIP